MIKTLFPNKIKEITFIFAVATILWIVLYSIEKKNQAKYMFHFQSSYMEEFVLYAKRKSAIGELKEAYLLRERQGNYSGLAIGINLKLLYLDKIDKVRIIDTINVDYYKFKARMNFKKGVYVTGYISKEYININEYH